MTEIAPTETNTTGVTPTGTNAVEVAPTKTKKKTQFLMLNSKTRFYGFRNTERLASLKKFIWLFVVIGVLGILSLVISVVISVVWFVLFIITLSLISKFNDNWFGVIGKFFIGGGLLFVGSIVFKILIEFLYTRIEKRELRKQPDGAEKYLAVMRASAKIRLINLALGAVVVGLGVFAYSAGFGENAETIIFAIVAIAAFVTSRVLLQKTYGKISYEIIEIRKERASDKYKAS